MILRIPMTDYPLLKIKISLVLLLLAVAAGCGTGPRAGESTLPAQGTVPLTGDMAEVADMAEALRQAGFGWWIRHPSGGERVGFSTLLERAAELEAAGETDQAGQLLQRVTELVRLAAVQAENGVNTTPAYPEP